MNGMVPVLLRRQQIETVGHLADWIQTHRLGEHFEGEHRLLIEQAMKDHLPEMWEWYHRREWDRAEHEAGTAPSKPKRGRPKKTRKEPA